MYSKSKEELENEVMKKTQCHVITIQKTTIGESQDKPLIIKTYKIREESEEEKKDENHNYIPKKPKILLKKEEKPIIDLKIAEKPKISIKTEEKPKISLNNEIKPKIELKPKEVIEEKSSNELKKEEKPKSLFDLPPSIFSGNQNLQTNSLFQTGGTSSLFGNSTKFNFTSLSSTNNFFSNPKKEEDNEDDDDKEDDVFNDKEEQEKEPPTKLVPQDISLFNKKFSKHINQLYLYDSKAKKFTPRGNGFLSVEISKDDQVKKSAVVVFRNQIGTKIIEGFITPDFQKFESYKKNYKDVASFAYLEFKEDKPVIGFAKVPFALEDEFKDFQKAYKEAAEFVIKYKDTNK